MFAHPKDPSIVSVRHLATVKGFPIGFKYPSTRICNPEFNVWELEPPFLDNVGALKIRIGLWGLLMVAISKMYPQAPF